MRAQEPPEALPVKCLAGVGLALRRDVAVPGHPVYAHLRVNPYELCRERGERLVLRILVRFVIRALKLYADGEIVALLPPLIV